LINPRSKEGSLRAKGSIDETAEAGAPVSDDGDDELCTVVNTVEPPSPIEDVPASTAATDRRSRERDRTRLREDSGKEAASCLSATGAPSSAIALSFLTLDFGASKAFLSTAVDGSESSEGDLFSSADSDRDTDSDSENAGAADKTDPSSCLLDKRRFNRRR
jgi:hypothetical protein